MRIILSIIALFSAGGLLAQEYVPTCGRELPRSRVTVYPTAQEAAAAGVDYETLCQKVIDLALKDVNA